MQFDIIVDKLTDGGIISVYSRQALLLGCSLQVEGNKISCIPGQKMNRDAGIDMRDRDLPHLFSRL
jgi:hypothetical protein